MNGGRGYFYVHFATGGERAVCGALITGPANLRDVDCHDCNLALMKLAIEMAKNRPAQPDPQRTGTE